MKKSEPYHTTVRFGFFFINCTKKEQTDAEHCLTANQLVEKLNEVSIPAEHKGIYDDIKVLNYFFKPADKRKHQREYLDYRK